MIHLSVRVSVLKLTCAGVWLLCVDLQEDEHRQEQKTATGLVRSFPEWGPPALKGWIQDPTGTAKPSWRGRWRRRVGCCQGTGFFQRPQGNRHRFAAGRERHCRLLSFFFVLLVLCFSFSVLWYSDLNTFILLSGSLYYKQLLLLFVRLQIVFARSICICFALSIFITSLVLGLSLKHTLFKYVQSRCCQSAFGQLDATHLGNYCC